jgi:outer membrane protein assembly factor BamB
MISNSPAARMAARMIACLFSLVAASAPADDWATHRRDNQRSGHTTASLPAERLHEAWRFTASHPPRPAWEAPARWDAFSGLRNLRSMRDYDAAYHTIAAGDAVYFGSSTDDSVHCLDAATGEIRWRYTTDGPVRIAPTFHGGKVYFGSDDGHAYCLSAAEGKLIWRVRAAETAKTVLHNQRMISLHPVRTGVMIDSGVAYFAGSLLPWEPTYLCAVDAATGSIEGQGHYRRTLTDKNTLEAPMLAQGGQLVAPQGRVAPLLFNRADGNPLGQLEGAGGSCVVVAPDGRIYCGPGNKGGWISEADPRSRKRIANNERAIGAVITNEVTYLLGDHSLTALSRNDRKVIWEAPCDCPFELVLAGEHLFAGGTDLVAAFDAKTGRRVWQAKVSGRAHGLAVAGDALLVSTDEGVIHCFKPGDQPAPPPDNPQRLAEALPPPPPVEPINDEALLGRWLFQSDQIELSKVRNLVDARPARISGATLLEAWGPLQALNFDGFANEVVVADDYATEKAPRQDITAEAWVRVDQASDWGGFVGVVQDNGDFERGWILGFNKTAFTFALASESVKKLTYLASKTKFEEGLWYHVAGTYDGKTMKVYVNGRLDAESTVQRGPIAYPPKALYTLGSYHDQDEFYKLRGAMQEVRVYERALSSEQIARSYDAKRRRQPDRPPQAAISLGPILRFTAPDEAVLRWETPKPTATKMTFRLGLERRVIEDAKAKTSHEVKLAGLRRNRVYAYEILTQIDGVIGISEAYECDTHFNYTEPAVAESPQVFPADAKVDRQAKRAIEAAGTQRGVALLFGIADRGRLAFEIARQSGLSVLCVDTDEARVADARKALMAAKVYGTRVSVLRVESLATWELRGDFANLVVADAAVPAVTIERVLRPDGGVAFIDGVKKLTRGKLPGAGVWSHQYARPDNTGFGGEALGGVGGTDQLEVQWLGRPGPRAQVDRQPRKPSPLAAGGRLFIQGFPRLTALDAYNGAVLWSLETPPVVRFSIPRDCSNWCADESHVYVAVHDRVWRIRAGDGELLDTFPVINEATPYNDADWGYIARVNDLLIGSTVPGKVSHTRYWTGDAWYDQISGPLAAKVCADNLFALDPATGSRKWLYNGGLIIHSTIAATDKHIYFLESRDSDAKAKTQRRLDGDAFWSRIYLVSLDAATGQVAWEQPLQIEPGTVSSQLAIAGDKIVLVHSHAKKYHTYAFSTTDGREAWRAADPWFDGKDVGAAHHGTHMSRPVVVAGKVIVRPWVYELDTGKRLNQRMPVIKDGHGCGTYAACASALIFRSGDIAMWNVNTSTKTQWPRLRPDCWLSTIPALGMVLSPEAGGGCSCGSWMETSLGFMPMWNESKEAK